MHKNYLLCSLHWFDWFPHKQALKTIYKQTTHSPKDNSVSTNHLKLKTGAMTTCTVYKLLFKRISHEFLPEKRIWNCFKTRIKAAYAVVTIPNAWLATLNISTVFKACGLCFTFSFLFTETTCHKRRVRKMSSNLFPNSNTETEAQGNKIMLILKSVLYS